MLRLVSTSYLQLWQVPRNRLSKFLDPMEAGVIELSQALMDKNKFNKIVWSPLRWGYSTLWTVLKML